MKYCCLSVWHFILSQVKDTLFFEIALNNANHEKIQTTSEIYVLT